ncbi:MAG TPA: hypothetical protein VKF32_13040 [Thermoanaerobaculia bacterium]|nr:hypothetical protein [Thermoanaerobaculia bacterium]
MEIVLALLFVLATIAAASGFSGRKLERARARRLEEELLAARRYGLGGEALAAAAETVASTAPAEAPPTPDLADAATAISRALAFVHDARASLALSESRVARSAPERARAAAREHAEGAARIAAAAEGLAERSSRLARPIPPETPAPALPPPPRAAELLAGLAREVEGLADATAHAKDEAGALARQALRISEGAARAAEALAAVEAQADSAALRSAALSSLANRMNLLAIDLAVLGTPGRAGAESGGELRALFEEARRLARDIGAAEQRTADAARHARALAAELADLAEDGARRARTKLPALAAVAARAASLPARLGEARERSLALEHGAEESARRIDGAAASLAALSSELTERGAAAEDVSAGLHEIVERVSELQVLAEAAITGLGGELRAILSERPGDDTRVAQQLEGAEAALRAAAQVLGAAGPPLAP